MGKCDGIKIMTEAAVLRLEDHLLTLHAVVRYARMVHSYLLLIVLYYITCLFNVSFTIVDVH